MIAIQFSSLTRQPLLLYKKTSDSDINSQSVLINTRMPQCTVYTIHKFR